MLWGIPGVDDLVHEVSDEDPAVVAMLRELGKRAGAEYGYTGVVVARRR